LLRGPRLRGMARAPQQTHWQCAREERRSRRRRRAAWASKFRRRGRAPSLRTVGLERRNGVAVVLLDRPPANAYDYEFLRALGAAVDAVRVDDAVRGVVVASALPAVFSAGADVRAFAAGSQRQRLMTCLLAQEVFSKLERMPVPVVAAIGGACLGGGLELALACGRRLASQGDYAIGLPEIGVGLLPGSGGTQRLSRLIGLPRALEMIATGETLTPAVALHVGLVDGLLPDPAACLAAACRSAEAAADEHDPEGE
jgi:enoyl-CoA hydratase/carnithine racemase